MKKLLILLAAAMLLASCSIRKDNTGPYETPQTDNSLKSSGKTGSGEFSEDSGSSYAEELDCIVINTEGMTVEDRFSPPQGFSRTAVEKGSFSEYLRNLPLKPAGSRVKFYDGREKGNPVHEAVIDMDVGDRDLQQCADAVMRLRAEYLYGKGQYDAISFHFTSGFNAEYAKWMQGYRISVRGNDVSWVKKREPLNDYNSFREYMNMVFAYAGTLSLSKELKPVAIYDMKIGDVFIQGGSPGHCVIVVDMAEKDDTGEKLFMIAQSYMPAQDIHILKNEGEEGISPWYRADFGDRLVTPEWTFQKEDLKSWQ